MKRTLIILCWVAGGLALFHSTLAQGTRENSLQVTPAVTRMLTDSIRAYLNQHYVYPDTAKKMVAYMDEQFKKGAYQDIADPERLAERLEQDLMKAHHDAHFSLHYAPWRASDLSDTMRSAAQSRISDSIERVHNFGFQKVELLPGNIGLVAVNGFSTDFDEARPVITGAFRFVSHANAVIIDLRQNGGGIAPMVTQIASYFFATSTHIMDILDNGKKVEISTHPENTGGLILQMPLYILTSRRTYSAAEAFAYSLQSIKRAVVVGDTSGGGAHITKEFAIGQGFVMAIPHIRSVNPYTHTDWEGTGVIPNIPVGADRALEATQETIYREYVRNARTDMERNSAQWTLDDLLARQSNTTQDSSSLSAYQGTYRGGLVFYVKRSDLYCRNAERGNEIFRLIPISKNKFVLDGNVHVEFKKDSDGNFSSLDMLWSHGNISTKQREK